jgi:hypothetical protein
MRAAYATLTTDTGQWRITAYDNGAPLPLAYEGQHGSAYDPRVTGTVNDGLRGAHEILTESGLITSGPWTEGPTTRESAEWRIALTEQKDEAMTEYDGPTFEATICALDRLHNTANGNPRFAVTFDDGRVTETRPDTAEAFEVENTANYAGPVHVKTDVKGRIWSVAPVAKGRTR